MTGTRIAGVAMRCGHDANEVSPGRCWPCHLADLRGKGDSERAERLERLKELQEAGRLSWERLVVGLLAAYDQV